MLRHSEQLNDLASALAKAQGVMEGASKDKTNPHFKSKYADLGSVWNAIREPLAKNGLSVVQLPYTDEQGRVYVSTMLMHSSGQWIETSYTLPATKPDAQGLGSAITYMKRYALTGMGVAPEDDDGNDASRTAATGNGHAAAPPSQRPVAGKPEDEAKKWAATQEAAVRACKTLSALRDWEAKNDAAIQKLGKIDRDSFDGLMGALSDMYEKLNPMAAG